MITKKRGIIIVLSLLAGALFIFLLGLIQASSPDGPTTVTVVSNTTKAATSPYNLTSVPGGYIAHLNISANLRNPRWKAFVGWVSGRFSLADSVGSRIYEWTLSVTNGNIYATRGATIAWATINCSNLSFIEIENYRMNHSNRDDNISATFNILNHTSFYVGTNLMPNNGCYSVHPYVENVTSYQFDETILDDGNNVVFATILENGKAGYNSQLYDFQMLVPENGAPTFTGITPYYLYVEVS